MMNKQKLYTIAGIVLSFVIAVGGWGLTGVLIDAKSKELFSESGVVPINAPIAATQPDDSDDGRMLTESEIISIIRNMESRGREVPHEPTEGQIGMGQAIEAGRTWLSGFAEQGVFPEGAFGFSNVSAYLCQNLQDAGQFLAPIYSYWTIAFRNDNIGAVLTINAVTGQMLKSEISVQYGTVEIDGTYIVNSLSAFMSDVGIVGDDDIAVHTNAGGITAAAGFGDGGAYAIARAEGRTLEGGMMLQSFSLYLTSRVHSEWDAAGYTIGEEDRSFTTRTQLPRN